MTPSPLRTRLIGVATVVAVAIGLRLMRDTALPIVAGALIAAIVHPLRADGCGVMS